MHQLHILTGIFCTTTFLVITTGCAEKSSDSSDDGAQNAGEPNTEAYSDPLSTDTLTYPEELVGRWYAAYEDLALTEGGKFEWYYPAKYSSTGGPPEYSHNIFRGYWFADENASIAVMLRGDDFDGVTTYHHYFIHDDRLFWQNWLYLKENGSDDSIEGTYTAHCGLTRWESQEGLKRFEGWDAVSRLVITEGTLEFTWESTSWETINGEKIETRDDDASTLKWRRVEDFVVIDDGGDSDPYVFGVVINNRALNYLGTPQYYFSELDIDDDDLQFDNDVLELENDIAEFGMIKSY